MSKEPRQLSIVKHSDGYSGLKVTSPRLVRSMTILDRSPFLRSQDSTKAVIHPPVMCTPAPLLVPVPPIYSSPKRNQKKPLTHKSNDCQFCVSGPSSSFQLEDQKIEPVLPDIKSFSLPRAQQDLIAKINERYMEPTNSRKIFKNGTLKSDFQWIQMKNMSDTNQTEIEKMHNYTNYEIVCMLHNIDDITKYVLEIKENIKKMHNGYKECLEMKNEHIQRLNDVNYNIGIISKSLEHLRNALPQPTSPPHYREVDLLSSKLKFSSKSDESAEGLRSILFKGIDDVNIAKIEKVQ